MFGRASPAKFSLAVGSGKGGVGKSTISLNIALALVESGAKVGILDADLYGPNIPLMVGISRKDWSSFWELARAGSTTPVRQIPVVQRFGLKIMSAGFIIGEDQPMVLEARTVRLLASQLVRQVDWGVLDYLVVDLPPGTGDIQQILMEEIALSGAVVVVTPQDVAHLDARKAVQMYRRANVTILGAVENMNGLICPHCHEVVNAFSQVNEVRSVWRMGVEKLGSIPLDYALSEAGDIGRPVLVSQPQSSLSEAFRSLTRTLVERLDSQRPT
ncbi:MAG: P-loop NTPase [Candidatus Dormibacteria bacterium]